MRPRPRWRGQRPRPLPCNSNAGSSRLLQAEIFPRLQRTQHLPGVFKIGIGKLWIDRALHLEKRVLEWVDACGFCGRGRSEYAPRFFLPLFLGAFFEFGEML